MEELIRIEEKDGQRVVSARELHEKLGISKHITQWIKPYIGDNDYGFEESIDYQRIDVGVNPTNGLPLTDYALTIDMAKELCMLSKSNKGKQIRKYFIECERQLKNNKPVLSLQEQLALKVFNGGLDAIEAHKQLIELETKSLVEEIKQKDQVIKDYTPKVTYYDMVLQAKGTITVTQIAKDYGLSGKVFNQKLHEMHIQYKQGSTWLLYSEYQGMGYTQSSTYIDNTGTSRLNTKWTAKGRLFIYDKMKKAGVLPLIERENNNSVEN